MKNNLDDELPLECISVRGALIIKIGEQVLAYTTEHNPLLWDQEKDSPGFRITNAEVFSRDVMYAINKEDEDGSTLLTRMLDRATLNALESGSEGIEEI